MQLTGQHQCKDFATFLLSIATHPMIPGVGSVVANISGTTLSPHIILGLMGSFLLSAVVVHTSPTIPDRASVWSAGFKAQAVWQACCQTVYFCLPALRP